MSFELDLEPDSEPIGTLKVTPNGDTDSTPDSTPDSAPKDTPRSMISDGGWVTFDALALLVTDEYGRKQLNLRPGRILRAAPPEQLIMNSNSGQSGQ